MHEHRADLRQHDAVEQVLVGAVLVEFDRLGEQLLVGHTQLASQGSRAVRAHPAHKPSVRGAVVDDVEVLARQDPLVDHHSVSRGGQAVDVAGDKEFDVRVPAREHPPQHPLAK